MVGKEKRVQKQHKTQKYTAMTSGYLLLQYTCLHKVKDIRYRRKTFQANIKVQRSKKGKQ